MYFLIRFDWNRLDSTRSFDRIVGCFDTPINARKAITGLSYDEFRNAVALVRFPINEVLCSAEPDVVFIYDYDSKRYIEIHEPYIENQYFHM